MVRVVCECGNSTDAVSDPVVLELNFIENKFYYKCPECKKQIVRQIVPPEKAYPKIGRMR